MDIVSVVDSRTWEKLTHKDSPFLLVVHRGESLVETILNCARALHISSASISGLGALENPTIAYFNLEAKAYQDKTFPGIFELIALNGNIAFSEDSSYISHIHIALGNDQYQVVGGHLQKATVAVTAEITFVPFKGSMTRKLNTDLGVKLLSVS